MKISIIIPSYKETKEQLLETLFSIDTQKRVNFDDVEVIVVNDCGAPIYEDKTTTNFEHLQNIEVAYLHNTKNGGPLSAREYGFKHSTGDYVQFIDAEDSLIYSFYLETVFSIIADKHPDLIITPHIWETKINAEIKTMIQGAGFLGFHGKVFKRELIENSITWLDEKVLAAEDEYFMRQIFDNVNHEKVSVIQTPQYYYKYNCNSLSHINEKTDLDFYPSIYPTYLKIMSKYLETKTSVDILKRKATYFLLRITLDMKSTFFKTRSQDYSANIKAVKVFIEKWKDFFVLDDELIKNILNTDLEEYREEWIKLPLFEYKNFFNTYK